MLSFGESGPVSSTRYFAGGGGGSGGTGGQPGGVGGAEMEDKAQVEIMEQLILVLAVVLIMYQDLVEVVMVALV